MISQVSIDTIAAMRKVPDLPSTLFPGRAESEDMDTRRKSVRWYRNDDDKPRVTYYPQSGWLRVEWSAHQHRYGDVDEYLARGLSLSAADRLSVVGWRCQRVDYCVDLSVGVIGVAPYLAALAALRAGAMQRQAHPDGVVWKAASRWVKFYDGKRHAQENVLRFEVSNYKQAVRYMAENWFGCERTVGEMVKPGRALYVLGRYWQMLGLHDGFAQQESEVARLRSVFGQRSLAGAIHALHCIRSYGVESYKSLLLMSKSSYYRWSSALRDEGFLAASDSQLSALSLPCDSVFALGAQNLKDAPAPPIRTPLPKTAKKNVWKMVAANLGVKPEAPRVKYLEGQYRAWESGYSLDAIPGEVEEKRSIFGLPIVASSALIGASAL